MKLTRYVMPLAAVIAIVGSALAATTVSAANTKEPGTLAQKLAGAFHLDAAKVQEVINQDRSEHQAKREQAYNRHLDQLVANGKITAEQKEAILTQHQKLIEQLKTARDSATSPSDRRALMEKLQAETKAWAKQHNLSEQYVLGPAHGLHHGNKHFDESHGNSGEQPTESN